MDIFAARQYVIDAITTQLNGIMPAKNISDHRGQFESLDEIKQIALRSPTVLVAFRGRQNSYSQGPETLGEVLWVIYVIAADKRAIARNTLAGGIAARIEEYLAANANTWPFAEDDAQRLGSLDISTLAIDKSGLSLWQISWAQRCRLSTTDPLAALTNFAGFDDKHFKPGADTVHDNPLAQTHETY